MNDLTTKRARETKLEICPRCGWYAHSRFGNAGQCDPAAGKVADALVASLPNIPATKLGYGYGNFTFEPDERFHIQFRVSGRGRRPFYLEDVWLLGDMDLAAATDLVEVLTAWRARHDKTGTGGIK